MREVNYRDVFQPSVCDLADTIFASLGGLSTVDEVLVALSCALQRWAVEVGSGGRPVGQAAIGEIAMAAWHYLDREGLSADYQVVTVAAILLQAAAGPEGVASVRKTQGEPVE